MGIFNRDYGERNQDDRLREERRINADFRNQVNKTMKEQQDNINKLNTIVLQYENEIRELKNQNRSLRRDLSNEAEIRRKKNLEDIEIAKRKREMELNKKEQLENEQKLRETDYNDALKLSEKIKEKIQNCIETNNIVQLEKEEKKLKENILIFKQRFADNKYKKESLRKLALAAEMLFIIGEYYYSLEKYDKALNYFLEAFEFNYNKKGRLENRIIKSGYNCGRYDIVDEHIENYSEENENKIDEYLLKLEIYIELNKTEKLKDILIELKEYMYNTGEKIDRYKWKRYSELLEKYTIKSKSTSQCAVLFFSLLYQKNFKKIEELLKFVEDFKEKDFFNGILKIREGEKEKAKQYFSKYLDTGYGIIYYVQSSKDNLDEKSIDIINKFISMEIQNIECGAYIIDHYKLLDKKYEFLAYKLSYLLSNSENRYDEVLRELDRVFKEDIRGKEYKGNNSLWIAIINVEEHLKKIDSPLKKEYENILYFYLSSEEINNLRSGLEETFEVDIDKEYDIVERKNNISIYNECIARVKESGKEKVYIELFETMSKKNIVEKKIALSQDKNMGENESSYLKIDNFSINDNKIEIITENYKRLYEESRDRFSNLTLDERFKIAFQILDAFSSLEKNKIYMNKLNVDNLVCCEDGYKFRLLNYLKTTESGSLSSTRSQMAKKSNSYKSPEDEKSSITEKSNIYIFGIILYEIFYGENIMKGIIDERLSLEKKEIVRDAFHYNLDIEKNLVSNNSEERFYLESKDKNTVKLRKVLERYYVPKELTETLEKILKSKKIERPTLKEIEEELENIQENCKGFKGYIPDNILKKDFEVFLKKLKLEKVKLYVREKELLEKFSDFKDIRYDQNLSSLMKIEYENGERYEISDLGERYVVILVEATTFDNILNKLDILLSDQEKIKLFAEKNKTNVDDSSIFIYTIQDKVKESGKQNKFTLTEEDKDIIEKIKTISSEELEDIYSTKDMGKFLKILNTIL